MINLKKLEITNKIKNKGLILFSSLFLLITVEVIAGGYNPGDDTCWSNSSTVTVYRPHLGKNGALVVFGTSGAGNQRWIDCSEEPEECKKAMEIADDGGNPPTGVPQPDAAPDAPESKKDKRKKRRKDKKKSSAAMNRVYSNFQAYIRTQATKRGVFFYSKKDRKWYVVEEHRKHTRKIKSKIR